MVVNSRDLSLERTSYVTAAAAGWLAYVGMDFLLHGVVLASWWRLTGSFWLPPQTLFARIPFAYLSFAIYAAVLTGLLFHLAEPSPALLAGLGFGALAGCVSGVWSALSVYSVVSMPAAALLVWPATAMVESAAAGAAAVFILRSTSPWRGLLYVFLLTLGIFVFGVILQNLINLGAV
jgi:hypothetical protein